MTFLDLRALIATSRPYLKQNSVECYASHIEILLGKELKNLRALYRTDKILKLLDEKNISDHTRHNYITAITVALSAMTRQTKKIKEVSTFYRELMLKHIQEKKEQLSKHEKTDKQEKNWMTFEELRESSDDLKKKAEEIKHKLYFSKSERVLLQNYVISLFYTNPPILPRLEIADLEVLYNNRQLRPFFDKEKKNYISWDKGEETNTMELIINHYKTDKAHGQRKIMLPKKMVDGIELLINTMHDSDILKPYPEEGEPMLELFPKLNKNMLGKRISQIFRRDGKSPSLNIIRHIIISMSVDLEKEAELNQLAIQSGHSLEQQKNYAKKN